MKTIILTESQLQEITGKYSLEDSVDLKANEANTNPTDKQKKAGNYKKGHISIKGMKISIENPKGSQREWHNGSKSGIQTFKNHYGYFSNALGYDGDNVDVFIGPERNDFEYVFVVDQNMHGKFDESKVMLGFKSIEDAKEAYLSNYNDDWKGFRRITGVSLPIFKKWLYRAKKQRKPFYSYKIVKNNKI